MIKTILDLGDKEFQKVMGKTKISQKIISQILAVDRNETVWQISQSVGDLVEI